MKIHVKKASFMDKKKDGTALIGKNGKPYFRVGLITTEFGDTWVNGFLPFPPDKWEGSEQELEITEETYQGKVQKKFSLPNRNTELSKAIVDLNVRVGKLEKAFEAEYNKKNMVVTPFFPDPSPEEVDQINKEIAGEEPLSDCDKGRY